MKVVRWMGSSLKDLREFPAMVRRDVGRAIFVAQAGGVDPAAKPLQGFGGASVMEVVAPFGSDTYRAVYTVQFQEAVYVLHTFQKKSKHGIATPRPDVELIRKRFADARGPREEIGRWVMTLRSSMAAAMSSPTWSCPMQTRNC